MEIVSRCALVNHYLNTYRYGGRLFDSPPAEHTELIVVIPCHDEPDPISSLEALARCEIPKFIQVEVIVIINAAENSSHEVKERNVDTLRQLNSWNSRRKKCNLKFLFHLNNELPKKHAGVGLARKIGMDEAVDRFDQINQENGIILCFDADSLCDPNYLLEVHRSFGMNPKVNGASIYFEHPIAGGEFDQQVYDGILLYESFLRYYKIAFASTGHPQAYHTVGSSMAVTSRAYQKQTGMNKRKAGEDFYFLQKIIQLGNFMEINSTRVIPSPRTSHRVPFGTGKAIAEFLEGRNLNEVYSYCSFVEVKHFIEQAFHEYDRGGDFGQEFVASLSSVMRHFIESSDFETRRKDLLQYGKNRSTFAKRFYNWFNAFRVLKFVHFARDNYYPNEPINDALSDLFKALGDESLSIDNQFEMINYLRRVDRIKKGE